MSQPLGEHPAQCGSSGSDLSHQHGHTGSAVGSDGGTGVETEPADPQHGSAHQGVAEVVRSHRGGWVAFTLAQHDARYQTGDTGVDVHHGAASEVQYAPVPQQAAVAGPDHVCDRCIHQGEPDAHEHQHRGELHALSESTNDQRRGDDGEGQLEHDEHAFRYGVAQARRRYASQESFRQATDKGVEVNHPLFHASHVEHQAVTVDNPQQTDQTGDSKALHHHRQDVLRTDHAAVEQRQTRNGHEQHQHAGNQHPRGVTGIQHNLVSHGQTWGCKRQQGAKPCELTQSHRVTPGAKGVRG